MGQIGKWLADYEAIHQGAANKLIHYISMPAIWVGLLGLLYCLPVVGERGCFVNWGSITLLAILIYYARHSVNLFLGLFVIGIVLMCTINGWGSGWGIGSLGIFSALLFIGGWAAQFIGHRMDGSELKTKQSFQNLLTAPLWLLSKLYNLVGIKY